MSFSNAVQFLPGILAKTINRIVSQSMYFFYSGVQSKSARAQSEIDRPTYFLIPWSFIRKGQKVAKKVYSK